LVSEHVKLRPGSGREATDVFVQGSGDVLISYENEAIATERAGKPVEHVIPQQTFKIENPLAVVTTSPHLQAAIAFKNFQYTAGAQKVWAQAGFRPVDPAVAADVRDQYPMPAKLWTIADLGGWGTVDPQLFDKNTGSITKIYTQATG
jgi:sulfate transport system substrate-binding protein